MYAWTAAKEAWIRDHPEKPFETELGKAIARGAYVWSAPEEFIIAYPVLMDETRVVAHDDGRANTWYVWMAALTGSARESRSPSMLERFMLMAPYRLDWVAWHRHHGTRLHRYTWDRLMERVFPQNAELYGQS